MAREITVDVDIRVIGQPECCRKYREAGWKFAYQPATKFIQADHPLGGKHSVVEVIDISRNDYECHEIGKAIAMLLNGLGVDDGIKYTTRCGYPVRIYSRDGNRSGKQIHGAVFTDCLGWSMFSWLPNGQAYSSDPKHDYDLIETS